MPVPAKLIPLDPQHARMTPFPTLPGQFRFEDMAHHASAPPAPGERGRFSFACPRGTGHCGSIVIGNGLKPPGDRTWEWDGNMERPTLKPSVNCLAGPTGNPKNPGEHYAGCGWHAFVTDGVFTGE